MTNLGILEGVRQHFREHPNELVNIDMLTTKLGFLRAQIQGAVAHIIRENQLPIDVVSVGRAWKHMPKEVEVESSNGVSEYAVREKKFEYEFVGTTKDGNVIVRNRSGVLFKATAL